MSAADADAPDVEVTDDVEGPADTAADDPQPIPADKLAELRARAGTSTIRVYQVDGRHYVFRKPKKPEYDRYKAQALSQNPDTRVQAALLLARSCLVAFDKGTKIEDERAAFDELAEDAPGMAHEIFGQVVVTMGFGERKFLEKKVVSS